MTGQRVIFRADANHAVGSGHVSRCHKLAKQLVMLGANVAFVSRRQRSRVPTIADGMSVIHFDAVAALGGEDRPSSMQSSVASELSDAERTVGAFPAKPDWVVVDSYELGATWEAAVRSQCGRLAVIDDLGRPHDCDLLIDPNWHGSKTETRYAGRVSPLTQSLLGPDFALLDPAFAKSRVSPTNRQGKVKRVLVYFGGSDQYGLTPLALTVLAKPEFARLEVDVVIGATNKASPLGNAVAINRPGVTVYEHQNSLAKLLAGVDVAIGAVGGTTWERMCLGVPSLTVVIADNQLETANDLAAAGLIDLLGHATNVTEETLAQGLRELLNAPERRQRMADAGQALVDGRGAERVVDVLCGLLA